jgi:hypothetical protein
MELCRGNAGVEHPSEPHNRIEDHELADISGDTCRIFSGTSCVEAIEVGVQTGVSSVDPIVDSIVGACPGGLPFGNTNIPGDPLQGVKDRLRTTVEVLTTVVSPLTCDARKVKCVSKKATALLKCHSKAAKLGTTADPVCLSKAMTKFSDAGSGCIVKAEATGGCRTPGNVMDLEDDIDLFVDDSRMLLNYPGASGANKCLAKKTLCMRKKLKTLLKCQEKGLKAGRPAHSGCPVKALEKFSDCIAASEANGGCVTNDDTVALEQNVDEFVNQIVVEILGGGPPPTPTP